MESSCNNAIESAYISLDIAVDNSEYLAVEKDIHSVIEECTTMHLPNGIINVAANDFKIGKLIGEGGFSKVYSAELCGIKVAIKVQSIKHELNMYLEINANKCLQDIDGVCKYYGYLRTETFVYFIYEYLSGKELYQHIVDKTIPPQKILGIIIELFKTLEQIHQHGIVHLDIKPENIFITDKWKVKVLDFGLARNISDIILEPCGSPFYLAHEFVVYSKSYKVVEAIDIWGIGIIMWTMYTGNNPFDHGEDIEDTQELRNLILRNILDLNKSTIGDKKIPIAIRKFLNTRVFVRPGKRVNSVDAIDFLERNYVETYGRCRKHELRHYCSDSD